MKTIIELKTLNINPILGGPTQTASMNQEEDHMKECIQDYNQCEDQACLGLHHQIVSEESRVPHEKINDSYAVPGKLCKSINKVVAHSTMGIHLRRRRRSTIIRIVIGIVIPHCVCCPSDASDESHTCIDFGDKSKRRQKAVLRPWDAALPSYHDKLATYQSRRFTRASDMLFRT